MRKGHLPKNGRENLPAPVAAFVVKYNLLGSFATVLFPFAQKEEIPELRRLENQDADVVTLQLSWQDGRKDLIAVAPSHRELTLGGRTGDGVAMVLYERDGETSVDTVRGSL